MEKVKIAPSILSADFADIGREVENIIACGADMIHCDVMDGVFVPNITFGIKMVADIKKHSSVPLDCHLMIINPEKYVEQFAKAGADYITVHYEACKENTASVLKKIKEFGIKCGVVINPDTDWKKIEDVVPLCDMVLVMSVFPGFGGQKFIADVLDKCKALKTLIDKTNKDILLEIDGGINANTAPLAVESGCNVLVAGSAVFNAQNRKQAIFDLKSV